MSDRETATAHATMIDKGGARIVIMTGAEGGTTGIPGEETTTAAKILTAGTGTRRGETTGGREIARDPRRVSAASNTRKSVAMMTWMTEIGTTGAVVGPSEAIDNVRGHRAAKTANATVDVIGTRIPLPHHPRKRRRNLRTLVMTLQSHRQGRPQPAVAVAVL